MRSIDDFNREQSPTRTLEVLRETLAQMEVENELFVQVISGIQKEVGEDIAAIQKELGVKLKAVFKNYCGATTKDKLK